MHYICNKQLWSSAAIGGGMLGGCTLYGVLSGLTIEAKTGMRIYDWCCAQVRSAHCTAPVNVCKVCVCINDVLQMCTLSIGRALRCMFLQCTAWWPVSSSLSALLLDSPERPIACPPSLRGHSRFWCYSDGCVAYGLTLSVI